MGERKKVIESNFLLAPDPKQRYDNINLIYGGWSRNKALDLMKAYGVDYIYISEKVKNLYKDADITLENEECIRKVKERIYQFIC